jgi:hypothetical protein
VHWLLLSVVFVAPVADALHVAPLSLIRRNEFVKGEYSTRHPFVPFTIVLNNTYVRSIGAPPGLAVENRPVNVCDKPDPEFGVMLTTVGATLLKPVCVITYRTPLTEMNPVRATPGLDAIE